ncbi:MAG TPA: hypothetical protein VFT74_04935, partial [Isosphaeraceae bacterium]|nr:hypothetical protein [Isosphaeraceae bacterium]
IALGLGGGVWQDVAKLAACVGLAGLSWRFLEKPILSLKDRFPYEPRQRSEPAYRPRFGLRKRDTAHHSASTPDKAPKTGATEAP